MTSTRSIATPILAAFLVLALVIAANGVFGLWAIQRLSDTSRRVGSELAPLS